MEVRKYKRLKELAGWEELLHLAENVKYTNDPEHDFRDFESTVIKSDEMAKRALLQGGYLLYKDVESKYQFEGKVVVQLYKRIVFVFNINDNLYEVIVFDYK